MGQRDALTGTGIGVAPMVVSEQEELQRGLEVVSCLKATLPWLSGARREPSAARHRNAAVGLVLCGAVRRGGQRQ